MSPTRTYKSHIDVRHLGVFDLDRLHEIDRREHLTYAYRLEGNALVRYAVDWNIPDWDHVGDGGHSVQRLVNWLRPIIDNGALFFGAFVDDSLAGVVVVDTEFETNLAWLTFLHVSRTYRGRGIGRTLWEHAMDLAVEADARLMYVSATPSGPTIDFYLGRGCELADPPHATLLMEEPEDIHLTCAVR